MTYRIRIVSSLSEVGQQQWNQLLALQSQSNPFLSFEFLHALHETGCAAAESGWQPQFITVWQGETGSEQLAAALPLYAKFHSYGEYVFDWAWADAYRRHGLAYYPKLLSAIPFTPVTGTRLMAIDDDAREALCQVLLQISESEHISSVHVLFPPGEQARQLERHGFMLRSNVQFHWENRAYRTFDDYLASLDRKKSKNIRAERRKVVEQGVTLQRITGADATTEDWMFFTRCYQQTYLEHRSSPYLTEAFFLRIGSSMPDNLLLVIATQDGERVAASLTIYDDQVLYGRYWGAVRSVPCLHFETAYYQPLEFCIERGLQRFEGGAQGEHKMARGFLPTETWSAHRLQHPEFASAVADFLEQERAGITDYMNELHDHNPFRAVANNAPAG